MPVFPFRADNHVKHFRPMLYFFYHCSLLKLRIELSKERNVNIYNTDNFTIFCMLNVCMVDD